MGVYVFCGSAAFRKASSKFKVKSFASVVALRKAGGGWQKASYKDREEGKRLHVLKKHEK